jgi:hypothetical protein
LLCSPCKVNKSLSQKQNTNKRASGVAQAREVKKKKSKKEKQELPGMG